MGHPADAPAHWGPHPSLLRSRGDQPGPVVHQPVRLDCHLLQRQCRDLESIAMHHLITFSSFFNPPALILHLCCVCTWAVVILCQTIVCCVCVCVCVCVVPKYNDPHPRSLLRQQIPFWFAPFTNFESYSPSYFVWCHWMSMYQLNSAGLHSLLNHIIQLVNSCLMET